MKIRALLAGVLLLTSAVSYGQLTYTNLGTTAPASTIRANATDINTLLNVGASTSFALSSLGLTFDLVPNYQLGGGPFGLEVGTVPEGNFFLNVSYLANESADASNVGQGFGVGSTTLFTDVTHVHQADTWQINASTLTAVDLWARDTSFGTFSFMDDTAGFKTFEAFDTANNRVYSILLNDDRKTSVIDYNDIVLLLERPITPVDFAPVPEPSTYGLFAAAGLLGLVVARRFKQRQATA